MDQHCSGCGRTYCAIDIIDQMVTVGQLVLDPDRDQLDRGSWPAKAHRPRKRLLSDPRYAALRGRMLAVAHRERP